MKMVAAAKLRRAQEQAEAARPYAERMERDARARWPARWPGSAGAPPLLAGTGKDEVHLLVVMTVRSRPVRRLQLHDRARARRRIARSLRRDGKTVKILTVGRKGRDQLRRDYAQADRRHRSRTSARARLSLRRGATTSPTASLAHVRGRRVRRLHDHLQPLQVGDDPDRHRAAARSRSPVAASAAGEHAASRTAPSTSTSRTRKRSSPSCCRATWRSRSTARCSRTRPAEQGARMTAMDSATRNAGDMINRLTLNYNRTRQAVHHQGADRDHLRRRGAVRLGMSI